MLASVVLASLSTAREKAKVSRAIQFNSSLYQAWGATAHGVWDFDDGTTIDLSGKGNTGVLMGGATISSEQTFSGKGRALKLTGVAGEGIRIPRAIVAGSSYTISAWIKTSSTFGPIFSNRFQNGVSLGLNGTGRLSTYSNNGSVTNSSTGRVNDDVWHHVVWSLDNVNFNSRYYIDGVLDSTHNQGVVVTSPSGGWAHIGCDQDTPGPLYPANPNPCGLSINGYLDDVRVYTGSLQLGQVQKLYAEGLQSRQVASVIEY